MTYNAVTGQITVPAGVTSFTVGYTTTQDNIFEADETTTLTIGGSSGTGTITNDDAPTLLAGIARVSEEGLVRGLGDSNGDDLTNSPIFIGSLVVANVETTVGLTYAFTGVPSDVLTSNGVAVIWTLVSATEVVGRANGIPVVSVVLDSATGDYIVTLDGAVDHADNSVEDILEFTIPTSVTDNHGATAASTLNVIVEDDGPSVSVGSTAATLTVDETAYGVDATASYSDAFTHAFGADTAAVTNSLVYSLSTTVGSDSGLVDTVTGENIYLFQDVNGDIIGLVGAAGVADPAGAEAFRVSVDATNADVTLNQSRAIVHADTADHNDASALISSAITLTATGTDKDGDTASADLDIEGTLSFLDDGPSVTTNAVLTVLEVDETVLTTNDSENFASAFTVNTYGADGAGTTVYSLGISGVGAVSGVIDVATGQAVYLYALVTGEVVGLVGAGGFADPLGAEAFRISVNAATGQVDLDQVRALQHPNPAQPNELINLTTNAVTLIATATDKDGDSAFASISLGDKVGFSDDVPTIVTTGAVINVEVDETTLLTNQTENFSTAFNINYRADGAGTTVYSLTASSVGAVSGVIDVATGQAVYLYQEGADIVGRVGSAGAPDAGGAEAFRISVNAGTGEVTLDQVRALEHPNSAQPNELINLTTNAVTLTATVTDKDGDSAIASISLGDKVGFRDDAPSVSTNTVSTVLEVDETVLTSNDSENFASAFTVNYGADGAGSTVYSLGVSSAGEDSLLDDVASGNSIYLYENAGVIYGQVNNTTGIYDASGINAFTLTVNSATGDVTLDQIRAITHPTGGIASPDELVRIAAGTVSLTATVTDKDNDTASTSIDLGVKVGFRDDAPSVSTNTVSTVLEVDETVLTSNDSENFASAFTVNYGADGAGQYGVQLRRI